ncbi:unnamed protein product [Allacma fusca]|uniref:Fructose-2,6-bisphosphatase TIGAR n=1 Tax=Allacma fusca TaxID=39272 RepID=A0A8J2KMI2_9HEXA|nr:unnamed protein product [Allacma fusca]
MFYFTIVRHGQTTNNVAKIVQSRTGGELTPLGIEMAKSLGRHLKDEEFTRVFSSDLHRCQQTTENIVSQLNKKPDTIQYTPMIRERDYGDWEFLSTEIEVKKRLEMNLPDNKKHHVDIPNGETYEDCKKRAGQFFSEILKIIDGAAENEGENILRI